MPTARALRHASPRELRAAITAGHPIDPDALAVLLFTSGTTSQSKAVMLSQRNIASNLMMAWIPGLLGWPTMAVKIVTMGMQAVWGFLLCRYVIFK